MKNLVLLLAALTVSISLKSQSATIKETTQIFRTYGYSDPDPVPRPGKIYPYYRFDGYAGKPIDKEWKIIELENEWIKVLIAPEIGGKILGAIEKSTGNEFLYLNKVIKFRDVAMRGAWTSGGIEFNFGSIGHAPSTASPVNYLISENPDGSVSCFLGDMDISSRTEWRVEVRLPADKAWFETHASWFNPTDFSTSKYQWMNAAADASNDLKYYWPGTHYIGHPGDSHAWPVMADGRDISEYRQNDYGTYHSYHVLGEIKDYYGGYYFEKDFGFGHLTDYAIKPGKKIWIWGLSRQGEIWVDLLTDPDLGNGQYTEIQTGILFNQAALESTKTPYKHLNFKSHEVERFTEYWFPVKETKGISDINEYGVIHIEDQGTILAGQNQGQASTASNSNIEVRFCALQNIQDSVFLRINNTHTYSFYVDLEPMGVYVGTAKEIKNSNGTPYDRTFNINRSDENNSNTKDLNVDLRMNPTASDRPKSSPEFDWNSLQGKYITALEFSKQREYAQALNGFYQCLEEDQNYIPALVGAAEESMRSMKYENAENLLKRALAIDTYHPQANYLFGVIKKNKGEYARALEAFGISTRNMEYRSSGFVQLSELSLLSGNYKKALEYAASALDYNRFSIKAYQLSITTNRLLNKPDEAFHTIEVLSEMDPLNHVARFELFLITKDSEALQAFKNNIKTEFPEQVFLELSLYYSNLNQTRDALTVLDFAPKGILQSYLTHYLTQTEIQESAFDEIQNNLLFPFRQEMYNAILYAENNSPRWQNRYYLGLMEWNFNHPEDARRYLRSCGDQPEFAAFYLARTKLFDNIDTELVVHDLERALKLEPDNWRTHKYMVDFLMKNDAYVQALEYATKAGRKFHNNFIIQADLAKVELYNGNYKKCLNILEDLNILPAEGAREGHDIYRQAHLLLAIQEIKNKKSEKALNHINSAREWPENLGVGKPYETDERIEDYLTAIVYLLENQDDTAAKAFQDVLEYSARRGTEFSSPLLLEAYSLQFLGQSEKAIQKLSTWISKRPADPIANWALSIYANDYEKAERAISNYKSQSGGTPWNPQGGDPQFRLIYELVNEIKLK